MKGIGDVITVGGRYSLRGLKRVVLFTLVEGVVLTGWFYLLVSSQPVAAFVELVVGLGIEHLLAGQLEHKSG
jgi:hypothetical protein